MLTGNKGEWSEIYVLFKLLGEKEVHAGDGHLNKIECLFYPIIKILRNEKNGHFEYSVNGDIIIVSEDGTELLRKSIREFLEKANALYNIIKVSKGAFKAPEIEKFMKEIHCDILKAKTQEKADIRIVIHDMRTGMTPSLGFSIKSQMGNDSTLLNAGKTTNVTFEVSNAIFNDDDIERINSINNRQKIKERIKEILAKGGILNYHCIDDITFRNNLVMIDSLLPQIIGELLKVSYTTDTTDIKSIIQVITNKNPVGYDITSNNYYYEHKIKNLLVASALGMVPHTVWKGQYEANGGYLVVKDDGDVLCYHFYDRNLFEDYLYCNTRLESSSTTRHGYAKLYRGEDDKLYFKLNLQIRFK